MILASKNIKIKIIKIKLENIIGDDDISTYDYCDWVEFEMKIQEAFYFEKDFINYYKKNTLDELAIDIYKYAGIKFLSID